MTFHKFSPPLPNPLPEGEGTLFVPFLFDSFVNFVPLCETTSTLNPLLFP